LCLNKKMIDFMCNFESNKSINKYKTKIFISSCLIMPRNRELDDAAMCLLQVHHHTSWLCRSTRQWVKQRKKTRIQRKKQQLHRLQCKQIMKLFKKILKQVLFEKFCSEEQAFENLIEENRKAVTAPAWVSANKKAQARL